MALEIRELIVKVTVDDSQKKTSKGMTPKERKALVDECVKRVMTSIKKQKQR